MISLNLFQSNWWDNSEEIYDLKCVNKIYFGQNSKKVGNLIYFLKYFDMLQNLGKC